MSVQRFFDRSGRENIQARQGLDVIGFSSGVGEAGDGVDVAFNASLLLAQFPEVYELGRPGLARTNSADLSAEIELEVPTGKFWRLVGVVLAYHASADAATRTPILTIEDAADDAYDTITLPTKTANQHETEVVLFGTNGRVSGDDGVAAAVTLTLAVNPTALDTMTIGGRVYTFVAADDGTVSNAIQIGANVGATQAALELKLDAGGNGVHPLVTFAEFVGNDMVITARHPGVSGNSIGSTETFTSGSNVFSATALAGGVDEATDLGAVDFPTPGALLVATDKVVLNTTNGHANDNAELCVLYIEYDYDPRI